MRVEERDGSEERSILISCVVSNDFLGRSASKLPKNPFRAEPANRLFYLCKRYYEEYGKAPGKNIGQVVQRWADKNDSQRDVLSYMNRFLSSLSEEYERNGDWSIDFALDQAESHFNRVQLERLQESIKTRCERGDIKLGLNDLDSFPRVNLRTPPYISLLRDKQAQRYALEHRQKALIRYPGAAGEFFGDELAEDSFIGVMGPMKSFKSWTLLDMAWQGVRHGRNVAYFQVGDLSRDQIICRFHQRAALRPLKAKTIRYPQGIVLPSGQREPAVLEFKDVHYENGLTWEEAEEGFERVLKKYKGDLRLSCHPVLSVSIADIKGIISAWDREGWEASTIIIDYAGNLSPIDQKARTVDQVSNTWALMRQISQVRKCLVVTANQTNKEGFSSWVLTRKHFAESKMILAHVTAFIGINATDEEKMNGVIRYNWVVRREDMFAESYCLHTGGCLSVSNPIVVSALPSRS
jgi:hypothetical protein